MINLSGAAGVVTATVQIIRKETGNTEEYQLIGAVSKEQLQQLMETSHVSDTLDSSPQRGD